METDFNRFTLNIMTNNAQSALNMAITQIGQQESPRGSNWGHPVQDYLAAVGIHFPASWCMAFVYWCYDKAGVKVSFGDTLKNPLLQTGGVLKQWNDIERIMPVVKRKFSDPLPGDIFIMDLGHGLGHCGFVEDIEGDILHTIEGNTNDTGSREGFEVCRKKRQIGKPIIGYLRF